MMVIGVIIHHFILGFIPHLLNIVPAQEGGFRLVGPWVGSPLLALLNGKAMLMVFFILSGAATNDALQKIERELAPRVSAHHNSIYLNAKLFARIDTVFKFMPQQPGANYWLTTGPRAPISRRQ